MKRMLAAATLILGSLVGVGLATQDPADATYAEGVLVCEYFKPHTGDKVTYILIWSETHWQCFADHPYNGLNEHCYHVYQTGTHTYKWLPGC